MVITQRQPGGGLKSDYRDEGCRLFPACLSCPRPKCLEDEDGILAAITRHWTRLRYAKIILLYNAAPGTIKERTMLVADAMGVTARTVERARALKRARDEKR